MEEDAPLCLLKAKAREFLTNCAWSPFSMLLLRMLDDDYEDDSLFKQRLTYT
jgi:hypothetical protein